MKKLALLLAFVTVASITNAQTEKGTWMVGGSLQFQTAEGSSIFAADPNFGYFFANNFAGGAQLNLITSEGTTIWGIGPYLRYYITGSNKGKLFGQAGVGFSGISDGGGSSTAFNGKLGYAAFLNKNVALEFATNIMAGEGSTIFGLGIGFQIHLRK